MAGGTRQSKPASGKPKGLWRGLTLLAKRRVVQWVALVALNFNLWALATESFCLPVMNCEACAIAWLGCPIGMLGRSLVQPAFPFLVVGSMVVIGLFMGRLLCGWVCPLGLLQDLLYKIPVPRLNLPRWTAGIKYGVLLLTAIAIPLWYGLAPIAWLDPALLAGGGEPPHAGNPLFFCNFCPTGTLQVMIPAMFQEGQIYINLSRGIRLAVVVLVLVLAVVSQRSFCKVVCPIGALIALGNKFTLFRVRIAPDACIRCRKCDLACPMDVDVMASQDKPRPVNRDTECIGCLNCEQVCPMGGISNNSVILRH